MFYPILSKFQISYYEKYQNIANTIIMRQNFLWNINKSSSTIYVSLIYLEMATHSQTWAKVLRGERPKNGNFAQGTGVANSILSKIERRRKLE